MISIIIPAFNVEKYIERCLDSVLGQSYTDLQIIVVDDGSSDNTAALVDEYAKKDKRIEVIHQKNAGLSGARNAALKLVRGDYIGYVDGDDFIHPKMYELMLDAIEKTSSLLAVCSYEEVYEKDASRENDPEDEVKLYELERSEALNTFIMDDKPYHIYNSVWSKLFKRELVENTEFPPGRNSEDIVYTTRALLASEKTVFVDKKLYYYFKDREGSIMNLSAKTAKRRFDDEIPFWHDAINLLRSEGYENFAHLLEYQLLRRELFYYIDFKGQGMKEDSARLYRMIKDKEDIVRKIYSYSDIAKGDRVRMRLFLKAPGMYYLMVKLYDNLIVPFRG